MMRVFDMGTDHNLLLWYAERGGRNEYDKQGRSSVRKKRKCGREWSGGQVVR